MIKNYLIKKTRTALFHLCVPKYGHAQLADDN